MKRSKAGQMSELNRSSSYTVHRRSLQEPDRRQIREATRTKERHVDTFYPPSIDSQPSLLSEETEYLATECRTSKIDTHLVTLKRLREKALKYTNQLDEIRAATKKRERELAEVMERLQEEEKHLHHKLEHIDNLNHRVTMKKTQLRQDQANIQQEERKMSERLQMLKEKEIFVNCQMVKLQSQEAAIKHRKKELQKERLRIEKLAYLVFKTDLSTTSYKEFNNRIAKMQQRLEKRYRKLKLLEHYCQHKSLPPGMKLEPITPADQNLDPALEAFEEALWGAGRKENSENSGSAVQVYKGVSASQRSSSWHLPPGADKIKDLRRSEPSAVHANPITGQEISDKESFLCTSNVSKSICAAPNSIADEHIAFENFGGSSLNSSTPEFLKPSEINQASSSDLTATKKSKSQQEGQIVKQASSHLQRLVMSAKETCASAYRLLQTPVPELENEQDEESPENGRNIEVILAEKNKSHSPQSNADPESFLEEEIAEENPDDESELYSSVPGEHYSETCFEEEEIQDEVLESASQQQQPRDSKPSNVLRNQDESGFESIFRSSTMGDDKISSHSVLQSDPRASNTISTKQRRHYESKHEFKDESEVENCPSPKEQRSFLRTPPSQQASTSGDAHIESSCKNQSSEKTTGNDGDRDRFTVNYDAIVHEQLAKLSETTRNEILYAVGHKALSQVAQVIGKTSAQISVPSPSNPTTHMGSQRHQIPPPLVQRAYDSHQAMLRRGSKSPKIGPRKIPSHLKFGNFNMRHRNRQKGQEYCQHAYQNTEGRMMLPQMRTSQTQTQRNFMPTSLTENCSENKFPEGNYTVGIIAEKILGIHTLSNSCSNNHNNSRETNALTQKVSHSRAFRV